MLAKDYNGTLNSNCQLFDFLSVLHEDSFLCIFLPCDPHLHFTCIFCICQKITVIQVCCFPLNSHSKSCCSVQISVLVDKTKNCKKRGKSQFMVYLKFQLEPCLTVFDRSLWKSYFNRTVSFKKVFNFIFLECF